VTSIRGNVLLGALVGSGILILGIAVGMGFFQADPEAMSVTVMLLFGALSWAVARCVAWWRRHHRPQLRS
jgi:hypothetical protein